jgi:hypothetical protein
VLIGGDAHSFSIGDAAARLLNLAVKQSAAIYSPTRVFKVNLVMSDLLPLLPNIVLAHASNLNLHATVCRIFYVMSCDVARRLCTIVETQLTRLLPSKAFSRHVKDLQTIILILLRYVTVARMYYLLKIRLFTSQDEGSAQNLVSQASRDC